MGPRPSWTDWYCRFTGPYRANRGYGLEVHVNVEPTTPSIDTEDDLFEEVELFTTAQIQGGSSFAPWTPTETDEGAES